MAMFSTEGDKIIGQAIRRMPSGVSVRIVVSWWLSGRVSERVYNGYGSFVSEYAIPFEQYNLNNFIESKHTPKGIANAIQE